MGEGGLGGSGGEEREGGVGWKGREGEERKWTPPERLNPAIGPERCEPVSVRRCGS